MVAGASVVVVWGIGVWGSISENLSISITLADQVTTIAISAIDRGVSISISVSITTISIDRWVAVGSVQEGGIGFGFGFSSNDGGESEKSNLKSDTQTINLSILKQTKKRSSFQNTYEILHVDLEDYFEVE